MSGNPKLTVLHEKFSGKVFELDRDLMTIGRKDQMDICIKDSNLSGHHADLIRKMKDGKIVYFIRDNDSTNGTRVNNETVTTEERELHDSDLILLGGIEVLYDAGGCEDSSTFTRTSTIDISALDSKVASVPEMKNLDPFAQKSEESRIRQQKIFKIVIIVLALLAVAAIVFVGIKLFHR